MRRWANGKPTATKGERPAIHTLTHLRNRHLTLPARCRTKALSHTLGPSAHIALGHDKQEKTWQDGWTTRVVLLHQGDRRHHAAQPLLPLRLCGGTAAGGIPCGAYHFFSHARAARRRHFFPAQRRFQKRRLPPVLDVEPSAAQIKKMGGPEAMFAAVRAWLRVVEGRVGVKPVLYVSQTFVNRYLPLAPDPRARLQRVDSTLRRVQTRCAPRVPGNSVPTGA